MAKNYLEIHEINLKMFYVRKIRHTEVLRRFLHLFGKLDIGKVFFIYSICNICKYIGV
jgi:hypothetical protein